MKVICINGSPHKEGNTYLALKTVAETLSAEGIETEIIHIGNQIIRGCLGCGACARNKNEKCITDDVVNRLIPVLKEADGIVLGSPVYYANIAGTMKCFCDRLFYVASATFAELNYFLHLGQMIIPGSSYWNSVHGAKPLEAEGDAEGLQTMRNLARNIAWLLRLKASGEPMPQFETSARTNFIR